MNNESSIGGDAHCSALLQLFIVCGYILSKSTLHDYKHSTVQTDKS